MNRLKYGILSLATLLLLAACSNGMDDTPTTDDPDQTEEPATTDDTTDDSDSATGTQESGQDASGGILALDLAINFDDAVQTFYDTFGETVNIDEIHFEHDDGSYRYEISGWDDSNDYELEINAETGDIMDQSTESKRETDDILPVADVISPLEAMNTAIAASSTDVVEEWDLEIENGQPVYTIDLENNVDVKVDAITGDIK